MIVQRASLQVPRAGPRVSPRVLGASLKLSPWGLRASQRGLIEEEEKVEEEEEEEKEKKSRRKRQKRRT